jgi:hypothetical protein
MGGLEKPHIVKIRKTGINLVKLDLTIGERKKLGINGWLGVENYYIGIRLNNKREPMGTGIYLTNFETVNGEKWEQVGNSFNNCGLSVELDSE